MNVNIKIDGKDEVIQNINKLSAAAKKAVKEQVGKSALNIQKNAKARCPVDTGALRNSITVDFYGELSAEIAPHMPYASHVEFGTHKMTARPYMTPAAEEERSKFENAVANAIKGEIG